MAGWRRAAQARTGTGEEPAVSGVLRGGAAGGTPDDDRCQRLPAGGLQRLRPKRVPGAAAVCGPGVPAPGAATAQPRRRDACARHEARDGGVPCGRGRVRATAGLAVGWPSGGASRRGHPVRRCDQLATVAATVGNRPGRSVGRCGCRTGRGRARRGREPSGPPRGLLAVRLHPAGVDVAVPGEVAAAVDRAAVAGPSGARGHQPLRGRRVPAQQRRGVVAEPDVPFPADRRPLRRVGAGGRTRLPVPHRADVLEQSGLGADRLG